MDNAVVTILAGLSAMSSALIAGTFFAFSTFVMRSLGALAPAHGAAAMQSINAIILRSLFMPIFMGASVLSPLLAAWPWCTGGSPDRRCCGGLATHACSGARWLQRTAQHVLALRRRRQRAGDSVWEDYLNRWTGWNHVNTIAATTSKCPCPGADPSSSTDAMSSGFPEPRRP